MTGWCYNGIMSDFESDTPLDACSGDIRDCEVLRAAFVLQDADPANERAQELRRNLAAVACQDCTRTYLSDVRTDEPASGRARKQRAIIASETFWFGGIQATLPPGPLA